MLRKLYLLPFVLLLFIQCSFAQNTLNEFYNEQLLSYTIDQNLPKIKWCIDEGADINCTNDNGATPLLIAVEKGNLEIVKTLLYYKANPNKSTFDKFTPLMMSIFVGNIDIAEILIKQEADLNLTDDKGCTALHYSVALGDFVMSDMLIFYGADANLKTGDENTNLHIAAFSQDTNLVRLLLNKDISIDGLNDVNYTSLMIAAQNGYDQVVNFLLKNGSNPNYTNPKGLNALNLAIYNHHENVVDVILKYQKSLNDSNTNKFYNPIVVAKTTGQNTVLKKLKQHGFSNKNRFLLQSITINSGINFNSEDKIFNFNLGVREINSDMFFSLGYQTRFVGKQILMNYNSDKYLVWEHRRIIDFEAEKYFRFWVKGKSSLSASVGGDFQLVFGPYDGFRRKIDTRFIVVPQIGMVYSTKVFDYGLYYMYPKYDILEIPTGRIKLSFTIKIPFSSKPEKYMLSWM